MMLITATFIGQDHSLGYTHGARYTLRLLRTRHNVAIVIERMDGTGFCPYVGIHKFLENWSNVSMIPE